MWVKFPLFRKIIPQKFATYCFFSYICKKISCIRQSERKISFRSFAVSCQMNLKNNRLPCDMRCKKKKMIYIS